MIDVVTASAAALNFAYFARRYTSAHAENAPRRTAALVPAVVSLGTLVESLALLAIGAEAETPALSSGSWALVRALPFAGTLGMAALVARRMVGGR
jgi:hypothetical protein